MKGTHIVHMRTWNGNCMISDPQTAHTYTHTHIPTNLEALIHLWLCLTSSLELIGKMEGRKVRALGLCSESKLSSTGLSGSGTEPCSCS